MDGMQGRKLVFVIAATNRPDMIDPAMLRPGRLDKALYVDLPNADERLAILKTITRNTPLDQSVNLEHIARTNQCDGMSGADLASLVREASVIALRKTFYSGSNVSNTAKVTVSQKDFILAFEKVSCSVSTRDRKKYELLKVKFGTAAE
jgi:ribosome biogenesis ATPase